MASKRNFRSEWYVHEASGSDLFSNPVSKAFFLRWLSIAAEESTDNRPRVPGFWGRWYVERRCQRTKMATQRFLI
jgi:hypothetical protein